MSLGRAVKLGNWIRGQRVDPTSLKYLDNINPFTQEIVNHVPLSTSTDVNHAVQSAKEIFPLWSELSKHQRAEYLFQIANEIEKNFDVNLLFLIPFPHFSHTG
jgi:acyl-CoA reductase-like NAD-dependent aldehyde dehydrogenase